MMILWNSLDGLKRNEKQWSERLVDSQVYHINPTNHGHVWCKNGWINIINPKTPIEFPGFQGLPALKKQMAKMVKICWDLPGNHAELSPTDISWTSLGMRVHNTPRRSTGISTTLSPKSGYHIGTTTLDDVAEKMLKIPKHSGTMEHTQSILYGYQYTNLATL
jgi:hypothetical protein